jgi:TPR repeat protein
VVAGISEAFEAWGSEPIVARRRFRALATEGDPRAQCAYALMVANGRGGGTDPAAAVIWYRRAADQGHPVACYSLAAALSEGRGVAPDPQEAARWYRRAAELGDRDALQALGVLYSTGEGVDADAAEAERWWRRAAARGHPAALRSLGHALAAVDLPEAAAWYLDAAVAGDEASVEALARVLPRVREAVEAGSGAAAWVAAAFADDAAERARLSALAVSRGHGRACYEAAQEARARGEEGWPAMMGLLERAAAAGCEDAEHDLATAHATGAGVPRDLRAAADGYRRAARWGRPGSLHGLGAALLELSSESEPEGGDREGALEALLEAAVGGYPPAMALYATQMVDEDRVAALRWLLEADSAGHGGAGDVARQLGAAMSAEDVARADRQTQTDGAVAAEIMATTTQ